MMALQSRYEILSPEGLRTDGRRWNEIRRFSAKMATTTAADGSSYVEHGNTKVICSVNGPIEPRTANARNSERATVTVDVCFAAFSGTDRKKRGKGDKRVLEMQSALSRTFAATLLTTLHPRSEVHISLHILSQDGSILATCVNATTLALVDAGVPMTDYVTACTVASYTNPDESDEPLLDMSSAEEMDLPGITLATVGRSDKISLLQLETKVRLERLEGMLAVGIDGCGKIRQLLDGVVREHGNEMASVGAL
ncbi:ribosomal protein S5 domain 2-type protein [Tuber brumale]|nr:ribosomal protein S5 domain 2-type protein [Tuber brumale]